MVPKDPSEEKTEIRESIHLVEPESSGSSSSHQPHPKERIQAVNKHVTETSKLDAATGSARTAQTKSGADQRTEPIPIWVPFQQDLLERVREKQELVVVDWNPNLFLRTVIFMTSIFLASGAVGFAYLALRVLLGAIHTATAMGHFNLFVFSTVVLLIALWMFFSAVGTTGFVLSRNSWSHMWWYKLGRYALSAPAEPLADATALDLRFYDDGKSGVYGAEIGKKGPTFCKGSEYATVRESSKIIAKYLNLELVDHTDFAGVKAAKPGASARPATPVRTSTTQVVTKTQAISNSQLTAKPSVQQAGAPQTHTPHSVAPPFPAPAALQPPAPSTGKDSGDTNHKPVKKAASDDYFVNGYVLRQKFEDAEASLPKHYVILGLLGEGGMAAVFKVKDKDGKLYAAKLLAPELIRDESSMKRFEQEAQSAERLHHPAIAGIHEFGMGKNGAPYLVMSYMPGLNLAEFLHIKHRLTPSRAVPIFVQIADAAEYAHKMGVVHRDIKPSNIIIHNEETPATKGQVGHTLSTETAYLVDFGIAKTLSSEDHVPQGLTKTGEIFGSPLYMSPEQCEGVNLDARSDIYALGCVMYETLSGKPPFQSDNPIELILRHLEDEPTSLVADIQDRCTTDSVSAEDLNYIVLKCLRKDPGDRYQSMAELKTALVDFVNCVPVTRDKKSGRGKKGTGTSTSGRERICDVCGKPIGGIARTDVTRYLAWESRCQCINTNINTDSADEPDTQQNQELKLTPEQCAAAAANLPPHYEIVSLLGRGGMGAVFKVRDKESGKFFAVKMLKSQLTDNTSARNRFKNEAAALGALTNVNLAAVYDFGVGSGGAPYLVMDYLEGKTLAEIISAERCLGVPRAVDIFTQVADAMSYAHKHNVIHRDLKPSNVMIESTNSGTELVKLLDFGIAKNMVGGANRNTRTGEVLGSPPYMSPEQCIGKKLDERSDIYSFGCSLYEALCGHPPFQGKNQVITIVRHVKEEPESIANASKAQPIPDDLDYIVMRCLRKQPGDRYQNMSDIVSDLKAFTEHKSIKHVESHVRHFSLQLRWPFWKQS